MHSPQAVYAWGARCIMQKDAQKWKKRAFKCFLGGLLQNEIFCNSPHKNLFTLDDEKLPFCPFLRLFMHDSTRPNCWTQTAPMRYTVRDSHACRCGSPQNAGAVRTNYPLSQCSRPAGPVKPAGPHALGLSRICSGNSPFATHFRD